MATGQTAEEIAAERELADAARTITQEPIDGLVSPTYRYANEDPETGSGGDVYNVTNVSNYEATVSGSVYSPTLSTEYVNKLYVDNSIKNVIEQYETTVYNLTQDIENLTSVIQFVCED